MLTRLLIAAPATTNLQISTFPCPTGYISACRYCSLSNFTPELSPNIVYTSNDSLVTFDTTVAVPFVCGAPKCPPFDPTFTLTSPLSFPSVLTAGYCIDPTSTSTATTPYAGLTENFGCATGLLKGIVKDSWGCYHAYDLATGGADPAIWCGAGTGLVPVCYYNVPKPASYPSPTPPTVV